MAKSVKFTINVNVNGKNVIAEASTNSKELAVNLGLSEKKRSLLKPLRMSATTRGGVFAGRTIAGAVGNK